MLYLIKMQKRILLVDPSLTVQKVVALTLDKQNYHLVYAKTRKDLMKCLSDQLPDLILLGDQVPEVSVATFPKELESWVGRLHAVPPIILVAAHDTSDAKHYNAVLKKPFTPQALKDLVAAHLPMNVVGGGFAKVLQSESEWEAGRNADSIMEKSFNVAFSDESQLARVTLKEQEDGMNIPPHGESSKKVATDLWGGAPESSAPAPRAPRERASASLPNYANAVSPAPVEEQLELQFKGQDLTPLIDRLLTKMVPPIVERLVNERLDKLLKGA